MTAPSDRPIVIFGKSQLADLARFYFEHDSERTVAGYTVDADYLDSESYDGLPAVAFDRVMDRFPPSEFDMFLPISFKKMSYLRRERFEQAKDLGYTCPSYVSSRATTWPDLDIGENCFIFEDNTIQPFVKIGDNCVLWSGNHIGHHTVIEDHVFITSQVVVSGCCTIGTHSFLGVNSTVRDETVLAEGTLVGMASAITADTEPYDVWLAPRSVRSQSKSTSLRSLSHKTGG